MEFRWTGTLTQTMYRLGETELYKRTLSLINKSPFLHLLARGTPLGNVRDGILGDNNIELGSTLLKSPFRLHFE